MAANRKYTPEFRTFVMNRYDAGEKPSVLEGEFGLTEGQISKWNWHRHHSTSAVESQCDELERLRAENQALRSAIHYLTA